MGWRIFPDHLRLVRPNVVRFRRRLRLLRERWVAGEIEWETTVRQSVAAWIGHAMHGDTWTLREQILDQVAFPARGGEKIFLTAAIAAG